MNQTMVKQFIDSLTAAFEAGDAGAAAKTEEAGNVRRLQEVYRAIGRGDFPAAAAAMTDDVEIRMFGPAMFDFIRSATGPEPVLAAMQRNYGLLEDQRPELISVVAQGSRVVVIFRERGQYRPTGQPYELYGTQLFEFRGDRLARYQAFADSQTPSGDS
jgi:ketosteroid isomerase-like protein